MWPSYHWPGPKNGWCGLMNSIARPLALFFGATAHVLDPWICDDNCTMPSGATPVFLPRNITYSA